MWCGVVWSGVVQTSTLCHINRVVHVELCGGVVWCGVHPSGIKCGAQWWSGVVWCGVHHDQYWSR